LLNDPTRADLAIFTLVRSPTALVRKNKLRIASQGKIALLPECRLSRATKISRLVQWSPSFLSFNLTCRKSKTKGILIKQMDIFNKIKILFEI
jgi:hypothetical protein